MRRSTSRLLNGTIFIWNLALILWILQRPTDQTLCDQSIAAMEQRTPRRCSFTSLTIYRTSVTGSSRAQNKPRKVIWDEKRTIRRTCCLSWEEGLPGFITQTPPQGLWSDVPWRQLHRSGGIGEQLQTISSY